MFPNGLLILTQPLRHLGRNLEAVLQAASSHVRNVLYVHLAPGLNFGPSSVIPTLPPTQEIGKVVLDIYGQSANLCHSLDIRVLLGNIRSSNASLIPQTLSWPANVILCDGQSDDSLVVHYSAQFFNTTELPVMRILKGPGTYSGNEEDAHSMKTYDHVCLGGTFDRIHTGHKILLTEACIRCNKILTVGVTDGAMTNSKRLSELIEPTAQRISSVCELISDIRPGIKPDVVPITDPFGPSIVYPGIECLVVSQETLKGGHAVNKKRLEKGLQETELHVIELVEDKCRQQGEEEKISSSSQRKRLLGNLIKEPKVPGSASAPYLIGVTGGIASGKTSICKRLANLGAATIDCDKLGHKSYEPGQKSYLALVKEFGEDIVNPDIKEIDRVKLSQHVFNNESKRRRLNDIVWPAVAELAKEEVHKLAEKGDRVIFLEAALLVEAGWGEWMNELWVTFVPKNEAIQRLMERNNLPEEEAVKRIDSQISNADRISHANVVLCTLWETEVTQKQVEKAWDLLQGRLPK